MPTNINAERMADGKSAIVRIDWSQYVSMPESVLRRLPDLREWDRQNRLRDESNRSKIDQELSRLQKALE